QPDLEAHLRPARRHLRRRPRRRLGPRLRVAPRRRARPGEEHPHLGQLGLTGEWKDKPINPYGLNLRYEQSLRIANPILMGSDKWNERIKLFANFTDANGKLITGAQQVMEHLDEDRYGIGYGGVMNLTPKTKALAIAEKDG